MVFYLLRPPSPRSTLFPYTTLFRSHRSRRRILREAQALSKRGLLHRPHLSIDGFPDDHVSRALRDSPHFRLDRAVGRDAPRSRAENCAPAPDLSRAQHSSLRSDRSAQLGNTVSTLNTPFGRPSTIPSRRV